jgi:hypothetical protein
LRTRTGGGLRVYMKRPWYSSGDDELLGVVLTDQPWLTWSIDRDAGLEVSEAVKAVAEQAAEKGLSSRMLADARKTGRGSAAERLLSAVQSVTTAARRSTRATDPAAIHDAVVSSPELATLGLTPSELGSKAQALLASVLGHLHFRSGNPDEFVTHWGHDPIWGSAAPDSGPWIHQFPLRQAVGTAVSLQEAPGNTVAVVGHKPEYDTARKLWYCDLQLDAGSSYFPFVKLALARYQPYSIPGAHLSKVVFPDFAQLMAERSGALTRLLRGRVAVSLRGPAGFTESAMDVTIGEDPTALQQRSRFAVAHVERLPADAKTDLAWQVVGDEVHLDLQLDGNDVRYTGNLSLPRKATGDQLRLSLREYEIYETDESEAEGHAVGLVDIADRVSITRAVRYRLVYADYFSL